MKKWLLIAFVLVCTGNFYGLQISWCATSAIDMPSVTSDNSLTNEEFEYYLFHHDYMASAAIATLNTLRKEDTDEAIRIQQQIIDEIIFESFQSIPDLAANERNILRKAFENINNYYNKKPRSQNARYKKLSQNEKAVYEKIDSRLKEGIKQSKKKPKGAKPTVNKVIEPVLSYKSYMAGISISVLDYIHQGKNISAIMQLETVLDDIIAYFAPIADSISDHKKEDAIRNRSIGCLLKIKNYRKDFMREKNSWYSSLSKAKKEERSILDGMLTNTTSKPKVTAGQIFFGVKP